MRLTRTVNRVCQSAEPVQPFRMLLLGRHCIYNIYVHLSIYTYTVYTLYVCMHVWMDGCMYGCMDVWTYGCTYMYIYIDVPQFLSGQKDVAAHKLQLFFTPEDQSPRSLVILPA